MNQVGGTDQADVGLVRARFGTFAKLLTCLNVLGVLAHVATADWAELFSRWFGLDLFGVLLWAAAWSLARNITLTVRQVRLLEAGTLLSNAVLTGLLGRLIVPQINQDLFDIGGLRMPELEAVAGLTRNYAAIIMVLGTAMLMVARAGMVPSRPRYTAVLTAAVFAPVLGMVAIPRLGVDPPGLMQVELPVSYLVMMVISGFVWVVMATAVCTALSMTMYGLRKEARLAKRLGQYELEEKLGEGGMGVVYRASHAMMRRPTAVKLLLRDRASAQELARFEREVRQTARLSHPNTVTIYDYGRTSDGVFYYSMELLEGADLEAIVEQTGPLDAGRVLHVLRGLAGALAEAHSIGLIHRDIKPANIYLAEQGGLSDTPKLLDFGLVKQLGKSDEATLTLNQSLTGTPLYMAPEAINDPDHMDGRSDLYAVGAVAYFMLAGHSVFSGKTVVEVCAHHLHTVPAPLPDCPDDLSAIVLACLAKSPAARPQSAIELLDRLNACKAARDWRPADAQTWWQAHQSLRSVSSPMTNAGGRTLMTDLSRVALRAEA